MKIVSGQDGHPYSQLVEVLHHSGGEVILDRDGTLRSWEASAAHPRLHRIHVEVQRIGRTCGTVQWTLPGGPADRTGLPFSRMRGPGTVASGLSRGEPPYCARAELISLNYPSVDLRPRTA